MMIMIYEILYSHILKMCTLHIKPGLLWSKLFAVNFFEINREIIKKYRRRVITKKKTLFKNIVVVEPSQEQKKKNNFAKRYPNRFLDDRGKFQ